MNIYLNSNTTANKNIRIEKITFYNTESQKEIVTFTNIDNAKTLLLNELYNDMQQTNITIKCLHILDVKKKLKPDYKEKQPFYITLEHETKYYNEYKVILYLNENYYNNLVIKENAKIKEMSQGNFYYYDLIDFDFKNIEIEYYSLKVAFTKEYKEAREYNSDWDAVKDIKEEIQKEKELNKQYPELKNNKYLNVLQQKLNDGFNYKVYFYKKDFKNKENVHINIEAFNHIEKNSYRQKIDAILKNINNELSYKTFSENDLYKILKILNIDINKILEKVEA